MADTNGFTQLSLEKVCDILLGCKSCLILGHVNPDGDTIGSSLALASVLNCFDIETKYIVPSAVPTHLKFLAEDKVSFYEEGDEDRYELLVSVDVASPAQLGDNSFLKDRVNLMIDHHATGTPFADTFTFPDASATGEIIFKIYDRLKKTKGLKTDAIAARYMFAAISSDTGSFKYSNTTPDTFMIASALSAEIRATEGDSLDKISRLLHDTVTARDIRMEKAVTGAMKFYEDGKIAIVPITAALMHKNDLCSEDFGAAIDIPRKLDTVLIALTVKQNPDDLKTFKVSSRSTCAINVAEVCARFGGGGHERAAGCTIHADSPYEAVRIALEAFSEPLKTYKED